MGGMCSPENAEEISGDAQPTEINSFSPRQRKSIEHSQVLPKVPVQKRKLSPGLPPAEYQKDVSIMLRFRTHNKLEDDDSNRVITALYEDELGLGSWIDVDNDQKWSELTKEHSIVAIQTPRSKASGKERDYSFDRVFPPMMKNSALYKIVRGQWLTSLGDWGHSVGVFAYGANLSGKTHTLHGSATEPGLIHLAARDLLKMRDTKWDNSKYETWVTASFVQLYMKDVTDCLEDPPKKRRGGRKKPTPMRSRSSSFRNGLVLNDWIEAPINNVEEVIDVLKKGRKKVRVETVDDRGVVWNSNRSHTIFSLILHQKEKVGDRTPSADGEEAGSPNRSPEPEPEVRTSKIVFVDLAGPLRLSDVKDTGKNQGKTKEQRSIEIKQINKDLTAFRKVVTFNSHATSQHRPIRDSMLTQITQNILPGHSSKSKTVMMLFASDHADHIKSTTETLRFGLNCSKMHLEEPESSLNDD